MVKARRRQRSDTGTAEDALLAVAERLGISTYDFHRGAASLDSVFWEVAGQLLAEQPEFQMSRRGRPLGSLNKLLCKTDNPETLRKRRQQEMVRRDKYSR